jgi:type II secretion system protein C
VRGTRSPWAVSARMPRLRSPPQRLHLVRTIPGQNVHAGQAFIGVDVKHPQTYLAGAILESGARIDEIYRDHVVLVKGLSRVMLYVDSAGGAGQGAREAEALLRVGGPAPEIEEQHLSAAPLTDYVRSAPVYEGGVVTGFSVYPGARSGPFRSWGLKDGDVITALDGQPLSDPDQVQGLLSALMEGGSVTATVRRAGGESTEVALDGNSISQLEGARRGAASATAATGPAGGPPPVGT